MKTQKQLLASLKQERQIIEEHSLRLNLTIANKDGIIIKTLEGDTFLLTDLEILSALERQFLPQK